MNLSFSWPSASQLAIAWVKVASRFQGVGGSSWLAGMWIMWKSSADDLFQQMGLVISLQRQDKCKNHLIHFSFLFINSALFLFM